MILDETSVPSYKPLRLTATEAAEKTKNNSLQHIENLLNKCMESINNAITRGQYITTLDCSKYSLTVRSALKKELRNLGYNVSDYQPLEITWEEPIVTTKTSKQIALEAANEIADHFSDGFFDDGMVKDATDIINKHFSKLKDNQHEL